MQKLNKLFLDSKSICFWILCNLTHANLSFLKDQQHRQYPNWIIYAKDANFQIKFLF
jgi:hypothetical protein